MRWPTRDCRIDPTIVLCAVERKILFLSIRIRFAQLSQPYGLLLFRKRKSMSDNAQTAVAAVGMVAMLGAHRLRLWPALFCCLRACVQQGAFGSQAR
jgi:hypothetical protein